MKPVIAIPTHISGILFLQNLLKSFDGYNKYDIIVVINECNAEEKKYLIQLSQFQNDHRLCPFYAFTTFFYELRGQF